LRDLDQVFAALGVAPVFWMNAVNLMATSYLAREPRKEDGVKEGS